MAPPQGDDLTNISTEFQVGIDTKMCVICFSSDGDNLSQWRGYGGQRRALPLD